MKPSVAKGRAPVACPVCDPDSDMEGLATVGHDDSERGSHMVLEAFSCDAGHKLADLSILQEKAVLSSALDWLADSLDAMRSAADDARFDSYREEGHHG